MSSNNTTSSKFEIRIVSPLTPIKIDETKSDSKKRKYDDNNLTDTQNNNTSDMKPLEELEIDSYSGLYYINKARALYRNYDINTNKIEKELIENIFTIDTLNNPNSAFQPIHCKIFENNTASNDNKDNTVINTATTGKNNNTSNNIRNESMKVHLINNLNHAAVIIKELMNYNILSVDCEGVQLGRTGELCLIQISPNNTAIFNGHNNDNKDNKDGVYDVYLFDIISLGEAVFSVGLRELLESPSILKLLFDCRRDSESLYYQFNVKLNNVVDIQLLHVGLLRQKNELTGNILPSLVKTIQYHYNNIINSTINAIKVNMNKQYTEKPKLWKIRPLTQDLLLYAAYDVVLLHCLFHDLTNNISSGNTIANRNMINNIYIYSDTVWNNKFRSLGIASNLLYSSDQARVVPTQFDIVNANRTNYSDTANNAGIPGLQKLLQIEKQKKKEAKRDKKESDNDHKKSKVATQTNGFHSNNITTDNTTSTHSHKSKKTSNKTLL